MSGYERIGSDKGFDVFKTIMWDVSPSKTTFAYFLLGIWAAAIVFLILAWIYANKPGISEDQKKTNNFIAVTLLALIVCIYLTTAVGA